MPGEDVDAPPTPDAGKVDQGPRCPLRQDGTCPAVTWDATEGLPLEVEGHSTAVLLTENGGTALVSGGFTRREDGTAAMRRSILQAVLNRDGRPGGWWEWAVLPRPLAHHAQAVAGSHVYLAGGLTTENGGLVPQRSVFLGTLQRNGQLRVEELEPLLEDAVHASACVAQGWLVVAGGVLGKTQVTVQMAALRADGTAQPFVHAPPLPQARSHHAAVTLEGHVYLLGGFNADGTDATDVVRSVHAGNGVLTGWEVAGNIPAQLAHAQVVVHAGRVLLLGTEGGASASPSAQGRLEGWTPVAEALPRASGTRVLAAFGSHVLGAGGTAVWLGTLW
jgi:hypothetical protein